MFVPSGKFLEGHLTPMTLRFPRPWNDDTLLALISICKTSEVVLTSLPFSSFRNSLLKDRTSLFKSSSKWSPYFAMIFPAYVNFCIILYKSRISAVSSNSSKNQYFRHDGQFSSFRQLFVKNEIPWSLAMSCALAVRCSVCCLAECGARLPPDCSNEVT